jgi:hypothetical protein
MSIAYANPAARERGSAKPQGAERERDSAKLNNGA